MHRDEVAQGLAHLFVVPTDRYKAVVHPVVNEAVARLGFALGDFIFVVGELEVLTTGVNV